MPGGLCHWQNATFVLLDFLEEILSDQSTTNIFINHLLKNGFPVNSHFLMDVR